MNRKRTISWLLIFSMLLTLAPLSAFAEEQPTRFEEMREVAPETDFEFDPETGTITKYLGSATNLVIPDTIGDVAVEQIGRMVFARKKLESVALPAQLKLIEDAAFSNNALESIEFPDSLETIGNLGFANNGITSISLPEGFLRMGDRAFQGNKALESVTFPSTLTHIPPYAFYNATALAGDLTLSKSIVDIGRFSFVGTAVTQLNIETSKDLDPIVVHDEVLPKTMTNWKLPLGRKIMIFHAAFDKALSEEKSLEGEGIEVAAGSTPEEVKQAIEEAFPLYSGFSIINRKDTSGASDIIVETPVLWNISDDIETTAGSETLIKGVFKEVPAETFNLDSTDYNVVAKAAVDNNFTYLIPQIFVRFIETEPEPWSQDDFTYGGVENKRVSKREYFAITGFSDTGLKKLEKSKAIALPSKLTTLEDGVIIEKRIEGIAPNAFENKGLTEVILPVMDGQTEFYIGAAAFSGNQLSEIDIPDGVKFIDTEAFFHNRITSVSIPGSVLIVGNSAFQKNEIETLMISDDVRNIQIDNFSFAHNKLSKVDLPYSLFKIREWVFANNTGMEAITAPDRIEGDENYGVVHLYTRNPLHLHTSTYIYNSRYQKLILPEETADRTRLFEQINIAQMLESDDYTDIRKKATIRSK